MLAERPCEGETAERFVGSVRGGKEHSCPGTKRGLRQKDGTHFLGREGEVFRNAKRLVFHLSVRRDETGVKRGEQDLDESSDAESARLFSSDGVQHEGSVLVFGVLDGTFFGRHSEPTFKGRSGGTACAEQTALGLQDHLAVCAEVGVKVRGLVRLVVGKSEQYVAADEGGDERCDEQTRSFVKTETGQIKGGGLFEIQKAVFERERKPRQLHGIQAEREMRENGVCTERDAADVSETDTLLLAEGLCSLGDALPELLNEKTAHVFVFFGVCRTGDDVGAKAAVWVFCGEIPAPFGTSFSAERERKIARSAVNGKPVEHLGASFPILKLHYITHKEECQTKDAAKHGHFASRKGSRRLFFAPMKPRRKKTAKRI